MIETNKNNPFYYLNRMERFTVLLTDVRYCFLGRAHRMSRENIMEMLDQIVHDEHLFYMIYFLGAYKEVKGENSTKKQKDDVIDGMKQLMGWEKQDIRDKITAVYEGTFSIDKLIKKVEVVNPTEDFSALIKVFYEKRISFTDFINTRPFYKEILSSPPQATLYVCVLLEKVGNFFRSELRQFDWDQTSNILEDIFEILLEWISLIAGLVYYHLEYNLGSEQQV